MQFSRTGSAGKTRSAREKGFAVLITTLTLSTVVPLTGLAVDLSTLYMVKSKLYQSVDSAVLAGARSLGVGPDGPSQKVNAQAAAARFFNANFPSGYWGTSALSFPPVSVDDTTTPGYRSVSATASVQAPLYFLRILGQTSSQVSVSAAAGRRDALVMLVLDRSSSMNNVFMGQSACSVMKTDAAQFVTNFALGRDMVGLAVFGATVYVVPPTTAFTTGATNLPNLISQITCTGNTNTVTALNKAYGQIQAVNSTVKTNVIVLMTDGRPNGFAANFDKQSDGCGKPLNGVLAQWAGGPKSSGNTAGLMNYSTASITSSNEGATANSNSCSFGPANSTGNLLNVRNDISAMPGQDLFGNAMAGNYSLNNPNSPYFNLLANLGSVSVPKDIIIASTNAADNQGITIRSDAVLKPQIYSIALEGNDPNDPPDSLFLRKLANDPTMEKDPDATAQLFFGQQKSQTHGYYVSAPDPSQLCSAFNSIATQISIRLSR